MIEQLQIRNLGVIEKASLEFSKGLTVLTGETGAGKTMVLTSLRLLMGERAPVTAVRTGAERAEVDGVFIGEAPEGLEIQPEDGAIFIWRTIPIDGRSRGAIGGRPVPLKVLGQITGSFVTIHGQADQWMMRRETAQRQTLDAFAGHDKLVQEYHSAWMAAVAAKKHLDELRGAYDQVQMEVQYLTQTLKDIGSLRPSVGEEETLDAEIDRLGNANELRTEAGRVRESLVGEGAVSDTIGTSLTALRRAERLDPGLQVLSSRLDSLQAEAQDIAEELGTYVRELNDDPLELERLLGRRALLEELLRGRGKTVAELLEWEASAMNRLTELTGAGADPEAAEVKLGEAQHEVRVVGGKLLDSRRKAAVKLSKAVNSELSGLAMKDAHFQVVVEDAKPGPAGADQVSMELRSHKSAPFLPLGEGASGGELSRVMLAIEVALGERAASSTFVFDEVDAGVGGRVATEVGKRLKRLSEVQQVIVVTHLPQVASFADRHLVVTKKGSKATVKSVEGDARVDELVRMLGGEQDSSAARRHALELLEH